jgi:hypothetical protein
VDILAINDLKVQAIQEILSLGEAELQEFLKVEVKTPAKPSALERVAFENELSAGES